MTAVTVSRPSRADIDRQVEMLTKAYRAAGVSSEIGLIRDGRHWRLSVGGYAVTEWVGSAKQVWESLLDMRRAVETVPLMLRVEDKAVATREVLRKAGVDA